MKKILFFLLISNYIFAQWSISGAERNALISLYNSTSGETWSTSWNLEKDPKSWYGIKIANGAVREINLRGNALKGNFPTTLGAFSQLQKLDLSSNQLSGEISGGISGLTQLVRLDLSNNRLTGDPSLTLSSLSQLEELSLGNNFFAASDVNSFLQNFTHIKVLDLAHFGLNAVPQRISSFAGLQSLNLSNNALSQNFGVFSSLKNLEQLDLSGNQLTEIPATLSSLSQLKILNLSNNLFANSYAAPLSGMRSLEWLSLENNFIETFPAEMLQLPKLVHINFGRNKISGGTSALASLKNLEQIYLNNNLLTGTFPSDLLQLTKLQMLNLTSNQLTGDIPVNIPEITYLGNNRFNENQIQDFLTNRKEIVDFEYSPQRYDEPQIIAVTTGSSVTLSQSKTGDEYTFTWLKTLDQDINQHFENYFINAVENKDFDYYTCEAYFLKKFPEFLMEVSFFREPLKLEDALATEETTKGLTIYPNPTQDFLHIKATNSEVEKSYIFDLSGKLLLETKETVINVKSFPSAAYLISIKTDSGFKTFKFIKH